MTLINNFCNFYDQRNFREKLLLIPLSFVFWYALYTLLFMMPISSQINKRKELLLKQKESLTMTNKQIDILNKLAESNLFKEWMKQKNILANIQNQYNQYISIDSMTQSRQLVQIALENKKNMNILEIKNESSVPYEISKKLNIKKSLYQKPSVITMVGSFEDFYSYLLDMESRLRHVRWNSLSYEVDQYPHAKIDVRFSTLYEKK